VSARALALLALVQVLAACAGDRPPPAPPLPPSAAEVDPARAEELGRRTEGFYLRLAHRRFNTLETYSDNIMRDYFQTLDVFYDYYADLAQDLIDADFEKSRPQDVRVLEVSFETPRRAQVRVRFEGRDGRPLRPGGTSLVRVDRWERSDGTWWIRPGKL
jgi:hypothetical protein